MKFKKQNNENKKNVALFVFYYGSEVRQFIYSGFIDRVKKEYNVVVASRIKSSNLTNLAKKHNFLLIDIPFSEPVKFQKFFFLKSDAIFYRSFPFKKKFSYFSGGKRLDVKPMLWFLFRMLLPLFNILERIVFALIRDNVVDRFFADIKPSLLFVNAPRPPFMRLIFQSKRHGVKNVLVFNTLKEIDANGRINVPFDLYFTWSQNSSYELLRFNPQINKYKVFAVGSLYYDCPYSNEIKESNQNLLYCAANPKSIQNEVAFVERLVSSLKGAGLLENKKFIIRPNPMDSNFNRWDRLAQDISVRIVLPEWIWFSEENWNEALEIDVLNYRRLLAEAAFVIGAASTVAIDAVVAGRPFICIADNFWPDAISRCDFRYFSEAENFRVVKESRAVFCVENFDEMIHLMQKKMDRFSPADMPAVVYDSEKTVSEKILEELRKEVAP